MLYLPAINCLRGLETLAWSDPPPTVFCCTISRLCPLCTVQCTWYRYVLVLTNYIFEYRSFRYVNHLSTIKHQQGIQPNKASLSPLKHPKVQDSQPYKASLSFTQHLLAHATKLPLAQQSIHQPNKASLSPTKHLLVQESISESNKAFLSPTKYSFVLQTTTKLLSGQQSMPLSPCNRASLSPAKQSIS